MTPFARFAFPAAALAAVSVLTLGAARADEASERAARWTDLRESVFGDKTVVSAPDGIVALDTPVRAEDASLVPMTVTSARPDEVKAMTLFIDENPAPVVAKVSFGPAGDASSMSLRTRVNAYSNVHSVVETTDGKLYETVRFVKASGGCSAPAGGSDEEAMAGAGQMRLKVRGEATAGKPAAATLMIRHPNFTGMQMDQVKRTYTPARYLKDIKVTYNDKDVFRMEGDISISQNPVIEFGFKPEAKGQFKVVATDTAEQTWEKTFDIPPQSN